MKQALTHSQTGVLEVPERMVHFVFCVMFVDTLASVISTPVIPFYVESFGVSTEYIGYLYAAWSFSAAVFAPMLSSMADTWGRKRVLVACLVGAGIANVIQGLAIHCGSYGFWIFLFGRAFSGMWASVGATCNVYVSDVASGPLREKYLTQMAMTGPFALMLGPGLGGAMATAFGNNMPVLIDGIITLFSATLVSQYLVETPAFCRMQGEKDATAYSGRAGAESSITESTTPSMPLMIHVLGFVGFVTNIASQGNLAMYALFFQNVYGLNSLYVGFLYMAAAVVMIASYAVLLPFIKRIFSSTIRACALGGMWNGAFLMCLGRTGSICLATGFQYCLQASLFTLYSAILGSNVSYALQSTVTASFTSVANRGKIFGYIQFFQNCGKIVGPVISTRMAVAGLPGISGYMGLPFIINGGLIVVSNIPLFASDLFSKPATDEQRKRLSRNETLYASDWQDEKGSEADVLAMGKYVTNLLSQRHYKWVTRRSDIEALLDHVLPELSTEDRESYDKSFRSVEHRVTDMLETSAAGV